jgi:hypothetical protein
MCQNVVNVSAQTARSCSVDIGSHGTQTDNTWMSSRAQTDRSVYLSPSLPLSLPSPTSLATGIHDKEEAKICIQELYEKGFPKSRVNVEVVRQGLMQAMDASEREAELVGNLIGYLVKEQIITEEAAAKAFVLVLADLPDITIDIPMAPKIVSNVLHVLIELDFVSKSVLAPGLKTLHESGCSSWKQFEKIQALIDE